MCQLTNYHDAIKHSMAQLAGVVEYINCTSAEG